MADPAAAIYSGFRGKLRVFGSLRGNKESLGGPKVAFGGKVCL